MVKLSPKIKIAKYRFLALPILVGLVILILTLTLLAPKMGQILKTRQALAQEKARLAKLTQKAADLEGLDEVELAEKADFMLSSLPAEKETPRIFATLKSLGSQAGVTVESIEVAPGELATISAQLQTKEAPTLLFEVSAKGPMAAMKTFLGQIESTIPVMQISDVSLTGEEGEVEAEISLEAYFLPLPKTLGALEAPLAQTTSDEEVLYQEIARFTSPLTEGSLPSVTTGKEDLFSF